MLFIIFVLGIKQNANTMKIIKSISLLLVLSFIMLFNGAKNISDEYAVIYIHRLAKSTNSGVTYKVYFNDEYVEKFKGINTATSSSAKSEWIVTKRFVEGKFFLRVVDGSKDKDKLVLDVKAGRSYFVEFDASVAYGINSLKLLSFKEGQKQLIASDKKELTLVHKDLQSRVESDKFEIVDDFEVAAVETNNQHVATNIQTNEVPATRTRVIADVDMNIPEGSSKITNRYALIFGNEDYSSYQTGLESESNVDFAENDARIFKDYAIRALGIPDDNIVFEINANAVTMHRALNKMNLLIKNANGNAEVIFYYAGHGYPDEITKEPHIMPVDVSAKDLQFALKLKDVYLKLTEFPSKRITVFLDACFSGGARNQGLLSARAVKVKPKEEELQGKLIVFAASSDEQSSLPYKEKGHGMFTYFLLKKFQDSKGKLTYGELSDYIKEQVSLKSVMVNDKEQNPQTNVSPAVGVEWRDWRFDK